MRGAALAFVLGTWALGCGRKERTETAAGNVERPVAPPPAEEATTPGAVRDYLAWEEEWLAAEGTPTDPGAEALALGLRRLATALEGVAANGGSARVAYRARVEQVRQAARAVEQSSAGGLAPPLKGACTATAELVGELAQVAGGDPTAASDLRATADALPAQGALGPDDARVAACLARAAEALEELTSPGGSPASEAPAPDAERTAGP
ncbi:MAG TPA: hypothetical protein VNA89_08335 [Gemmatimonadaceae bacterium]|nr:hypothetical protein [Gemmatimonadaceae bacterium]